MLNTSLGETVATRVFAEGQSLHAPHLIDVEFAHVLRRLVRRGEIDEPRARQALEDLAALSVVRYSHESLMPDIWALRDDATAYDAAYLALTDALDACLLTCDAALATVPGSGRRVEIVS